MSEAPPPGAATVPASSGADPPGARSGWAEHGPGLAISVAIALILFLPHVLFRLDARHPGTALFLLGAPDEELYAARMQQVIAGDYRLGHVYFLEGRDRPPVYPSLNEWVLGSVARLTGLPIHLLFPLLDLLLPGIGAWLVYRLGRTLFQSRGFGVVLAAWLFLSSFPLPQVVQILRHGLEGSPWKFLLYYRTPSLPLAVIVLAPLLELAWRHLGRAEVPSRRLVLLGFLGGLLLHVYVFYATFAGAVVLAWWTLGVRGRPADAARELAWMGAGAAVPVAGFAFHLYRAFGAGGAGMMGARGPFQQEAGWLIPESIVGLTLLHLAILRHPAPYRRHMLALGIASLLLANKEHFLPGMQSQDPAHAVLWLGVAGVLLATSALHSIAGWLRFSNRARTACCVALACAFAVNGTVEQVARTDRVGIWYYRVAPYVPALQWLARTETEPVAVLAAPPVAELVPIYTRHGIYDGSRYQAYFNGSGAELERRFFEHHALLGVTPEEFAGLLSAHGHRYLEALEGTRPYYLKGTPMLRELQAEIAGRYRAFQDAWAIRPELSFRLDYVLWGPEERALFPHGEERLRGKTPVWEQDGVAVYRWK